MPNSETSEPNQTEADPEAKPASAANGNAQAEPAETGNAQPTQPQSSRNWLAWAVVGLLSVGAGLTVGEIAAAAATSIPSLVIAVGDSLVDSTWVPNSLRDWSIEQFGTAQKTVLVTGVIIVALLLGALSAVMAKRIVWLPLVVLAAFGALTGLAAAADPTASAALSGLSAGLAFAAATAVMYGLLLLVPRAQPVSATTKLALSRQSSELQEQRRRFLIGAAVAAVTLAATNIVTRAIARQVDLTESQNRVADLLSQNRPTTSRTSTTLGTTTTGAATTSTSSATTTEATTTTTSPSPVQSAPTTQDYSGVTNTTLPGNLDLKANLDSIAGISPLVVPNSDFYRIDTALMVPKVPVDSWNLSVTGMVDNPLQLNIDELLDGRYPIIEEPVTLSCVSNPVGGSLVGNAIWQGVHLADVLEDAQVQPGATQLSGISPHGGRRWFGGFPTELVFDGRVAMIAVSMNGEPLPARHGFPARLVVAGLYGYVSATKWLTEIKLTTWEDFDSFWVPRGWAKEGPIKTQSRIDLPKSNDPLLRVGETVPIAGVAWAPHRSITKVEVQISNADSDGPWHEAELSQALSTNSWRQWVYYWKPEAAGRHAIKARATDGLGRTQTSKITGRRPDGATGWHTKNVQVKAA